MKNASDLGTEQENHLEFENPKHRETISKVMNKWMGPGFAERSNEGQALQMALKDCEHLEGEAKRVAPMGRKFDVQREALSDRTFAKYGGGNVMNRPERMKTGEEAAKHSSLSDRKYR